ncbi:MAG: hypothetical protein IJ491_07960 [Clostridia bacterium]|nr:hypothetical protein [Clostridia bacterium]
MFFRIDIDGIDIQLRVKGYSASEKEIWDSQWCDCDFVFRSGDWLNYHKEDTEILLSSEVEELEAELTKLLNGDLNEIKEICCTEPDFVFTLHPQRDLRKDPEYVYIRPGSEIADIYMEWKIYFWHDGLTENFLTITFGRNDIICLRDYLTSIITN